MAGSGEGHRGGILGLCGLLDEHREAIDYDLLTLGLDLNRLGTSQLDWCRFRAILTYLPPTSAFARSMHGQRATWSSTEYLLAAAVDALAAANWQRGGGKGRKPKPIPRPGDEPDMSVHSFGTASIPLADAKEFFDRINRGGD